MGEHVSAVGLLITHGKCTFIEHLLENNMITKEVFVAAINSVDNVTCFGYCYDAIERHFGFDVENDAITIGMLLDKYARGVSYYGVQIEEKYFFMLVNMGGRLAASYEYVIRLPPNLFLYYARMNYHTIDEYANVLASSYRACENAWWILDNLDSAVETESLYRLAKQFHDYSFPPSFFHKTMELLEDRPDFDLIIFFLAATIYDYPISELVERIANSELAEELDYIWYSEKVHNSLPYYTFDKYPDLAKLHELYFSDDTIKKMCTDLHDAILYTTSVPFEIAHIQKCRDKIIPLVRSLIDKMNHIR